LRRCHAINVTGMSATQPKNPRHEKVGWTGFYYSKAQAGHCARVLSPQWTVLRTRHTGTKSGIACLSPVRTRLGCKMHKHKNVLGVDPICFGHIALSRLPRHPSAEACHIFERAVVESAGYGDTSPSFVSKKGPCTFVKPALCN